MSDLIAFYKATLVPLRLIVNDEGVIAPSKTPNEPLQSSKGVMWVFPGHPIDGINAVYNPANEENLNEELMRKLIKRMEASVGSQILALIMNVMMICVDGERAKKIPSKAGAFLKAVNRVDGKTVEFFTKFLVQWKEKTKTEQRLNFASFSTVQGRNVSGKTYTRVGVFHCPIYQFFKDNDDRKSHEGFSVKSPFRFAGVSCRSSDMDMMRQFIEFMFPNVNGKLGIESQWWVGSMNSFGNTFFALMQIYEKVLRRIGELNDCLGNAKDPSTSVDIDPVDLAWTALMEAAMKDQTGMMAIKTPASYKTLAMQKPTEIAKQEIKTPQPTLPGVASKKGLSLSDLHSTAQVALPNVSGGGKPEGEVIPTSNGSYLVVGNKAIPIQGGVTQSVMPVARVPVMTGTPYLGSGGYYVSQFDDGTTKQVEFINGGWVPAASTQPAYSPRDPRYHLANVNPRQVYQPPGRAQGYPQQGYTQSSPAGYQQNPYGGGMTQSGRRPQQTDQGNPY